MRTQCWECRKWILQKTKNPRKFCDSLCSNRFYSKRKKMIEDKKLGLKIAENPEEAMWNEIISQTEKELKHLKNLITFQEAVLVMAKEKIKKPDYTG